MKRSILFSLILVASLAVNAQKQTARPDLYALAKNHQLQVFGREAEPFDSPEKKGVRFGEKEDDGVAWVPGITFSNGEIEVDLKGRDVPQKSFIGIAFHSTDESNADIVYFRPFNFRSTDSVRRIHAVQYVSMPDFGWQKLRSDYNGKYEKAIVPAPVGNEWFHARIVVHERTVRVYVNGNEKPSLTVDKLNNRTSGRIGIWVGQQSDGNFANLVIKGE